MRTDNRIAAGRLLLEALDRFLEAAGDAARKGIEEELERAAGKAFEASREAFGDAAGSGAEIAAATEAALDAGRPGLTAAIETATADAIALGMEQQAAELGISWDLKNPRAVAYAKRHAAEMVTRIDDETRRVIKQIVVEGTKEGWSYDEIARRITGKFSEFAAGKPQEHIDSRAHLVAVTEIGNAYEEGNLIVAEGLAGEGLPMEHAWQTVGDARVSAGCRENEAAGWIPQEQAFPSGHMRPLRFPGCRCTGLYRRRRAS